ncbi:MAG: hypothetical protein FWD71_13120 [Oscillospiraceae bacterium]|nr:hypothetical protein [Oscillospiraceae bacterium]
MLNEKLIDTVVIDGVEFTVVEKAKTLYAGSFDVAHDPADIRNTEPDTDAIYRQYEKDKHKIIGSITPDCRICFSVDYTSDERPCGIFFGQETNSPNQPEGIHVIEAEPSILIRVKATDAAWALTTNLTGYAHPQEQISPLFFLIWQLFCSGESKYERTGDIVKGNHEAIYWYSNGDIYVTVPVKRKDVIPEQWN